MVLLRNATQDGAYSDRRSAAGNTSMEVMPSLKHPLIDIVYRTMLADAKVKEAGPSGFQGASVISSKSPDVPGTFRPRQDGNDALGLRVRGAGL